MAKLAMDARRIDVLRKALRKRFPNARAAAAALGIDARLLSPRMAFDGSVRGGMKPVDRQREAMGKEVNIAVEDEEEADVRKLDEIEHLSEDEQRRVDEVLDHLRSYYEMGEDDEEELRRLAERHVRAARSEGEDETPRNAIEAGPGGKFAQDRRRIARDYQIAERLFPEAKRIASDSYGGPAPRARRLAGDAKLAADERRFNELFPEARRLGRATGYDI